MLMKKRNLSWWLTPTGRTFSFGLICSGSAACIAAKFLPNTFLINQYQSFLASYKDGIPMDVPPNVEGVFSKTLDILKIPEKQRSYLKPFTIFGFDVFSIGSASTKWGALIGLPESFAYRSKDTIDRRRITVDNEPVKWSLPESQQLLDALVLSENAQIFAIAREIEEKQSYKFFLDLSLPPLITLAMYSLAQYYNEKLNLYQRPVKLRGVFYSLVGLFGVGFYCFMKDFIQVHYDTEIDKGLCEKDPLFVYGGAEYYQKTVERNIALRKLLGPAGEKAYSVYGNENFFIRQKRLPLIARKMYFESRLEELNGKDDEVLA